MAERAKKAVTSQQDKVTTKPRDKNTLMMKDVEGKSRDRLLAEVGLSPVVSNAATMRLFAQGSFGELDWMESIGVVREKAESAKAGDLSEAEATLAAQATTLNAMFNELARRAAMNMGEYLGAAETYLRLSLKAQSQCRATLETLAEIKNPRPVAFVKQANIANGPQQVNNGTTPARAEQSANQANELLELDDGKRMDTRATGNAIANDSTLETVGAINRAADD